MKSKLIKSIVITGVLLASITGYGLTDCEKNNSINGNVETVLINDVATSTTYDYLWWTLYTYRNKLTTTYKSSSVSYGSYSIVDEFNNKTNKSVKHTFEDSRTKSSSVSLGSKVTVKAIELEAGGDVSYSRTVTYNTEISIPKYKKRILKVRTKTQRKKYSTKVQNEYYTVSLKWKKNGKPSTKTSYQTIKSPSWLLK